MKDIFAQGNLNSTKGHLKKIHPNPLSVNVAITSAFVALNFGYEFNFNKTIR